MNKRTGLHYCRVGKSRTLHLRLSRHAKTLCGLDVVADVPLTVGNWPIFWRPYPYGSALCFNYSGLAWALSRKGDPHV